MNQLEELTKLVNKAITHINIDSDLPLEVEIAENLIKYGVIVTPCMAMVEQFIKDGKFDRKRARHNGRIAVVYIDKNQLVIENGENKAMLIFDDDVLYQLYILLKNRGEMKGLIPIYNKLEPITVKIANDTDAAETPKNHCPCCGAKMEKEQG